MFSVAAARPRVDIREIVMAAIVLALCAVVLPGLWSALSVSTLAPAMIGGLAIGTAALHARRTGRRC